MLTHLFWILLVILLYAYFGYGLLLWLLNKLKLIFNTNHRAGTQKDFLPEATLLIAAYNEKDIVDEKMQNTLALDYPKSLLNVVWVTDGSSDGTPEYIAANYPNVKVLHENKRGGKTAALNRAVDFIKTPFIIFSDANTALAPKTVKKLLQHFTDPKIGSVAGEKRIMQKKLDSAAGSGEGIYWQYESWIKKLESDLNSALAAAGELYAIRTELFTKVPADSIIDDFVISLSIARKNFRIKYEPEAYAVENASANVREELKRKIRIASGGIQTLVRYPDLFNFFKHPFLSLSFISHKVLRWIVVPFAIPLLAIANLLICYSDKWALSPFLILLGLQALFYFFFVLGILLKNRAGRWRFIFIPYYLIIMNYSQIAGLLRYVSGRHSVVWEKARRAS